MPRASIIWLAPAVKVVRPAPVAATFANIRLKSLFRFLLDTASRRGIVGNMNRDLESLATLLRESRDRLGLTLRAVEEKSGISNAYLSQLEGAKIKQPSPQILHKLCTLYECSYATVLEMAGHPLPASAKAPINARFVARLGKTTPDEESSLLEYLQFLRSRKR